MPTQQELEEHLELLRIEKDYLKLSNSGLQEMSDDKTKKEDDPDYKEFLVARKRVLLRRSKKMLDLKQLLLQASQLCTEADDLEILEDVSAQKSAKKEEENVATSHVPTTSSASGNFSENLIFPGFFCSKSRTSSNIVNAMTLSCR